MTKRGIAKLLLVAGVMSLPGPAYAHHGIPIYKYLYFSDGTYTTQVGEDTGYCAFFGPAYAHDGQTTAFVLEQAIGYCANDGWGWYFEHL